MPKSLVLIASCVILMISSFSVSAKSIKIGQYDNWGKYKHQTKKICYAVTIPKEKKPATLDHGDILFFISPLSTDDRPYESQFIVGYDFQDKSKVTITINDKTFSMFTKGRVAWINDKNNEAFLIESMKSGSDMKVQATSRRGNPTTYIFSLKGVSAVLDSLNECEEQANTRDN